MESSNVSLATFSQSFILGSSGVWENLPKSHDNGHSFLKENADYKDRVIFVSRQSSLFVRFLVGAFLGKSARLLQWLVFFSFFFVRLQSHSEWATFLTIETTKTTSIRGQVRSVEISAKESPLSFFTFFT